jgi:hypothetical protein
MTLLIKFKDIPMVFMCETRELFYRLKIKRFYIEFK